LKEGADKNTLAYKISYVFAHVWGKLEICLPTEVLEDFETARAKLDSLSIDAGMREDKKGLKYTIKTPGGTAEYKTSKKAPAAGLVAMSYCRYVVDLSYSGDRFILYVYLADMADLPTTRRTSTTTVPHGMPPDLHRALIGETFTLLNMVS
jgi:hypothetical protein